jgi:DNA polymerase (family X)
MEKRLVFKKGRFVLTREGKFVINLSDKIIKQIKPFCKRVQIAGSIRRKEKNPTDIDIVLIPKDRINLENFMKKKFKFLLGGEHISRWKIEGVQTELYYADEENFGAMLLAYSSKFGAGIGLRLIAKRKGFKLNQYGLFDKKGKKVAGKTEKEIYYSLGRKWKLPKNR